jgi:anti-anti-sigma factor
MKLTLQGIDRDGLVCVAAEGTVTAADFHIEQKNPLEGALGPNWSTMRILLDLKAVTFIDSSAIGWLIDANKTVRSAGGALIIHSIQPKVRQIFDLLRLGKALSLADDEVAARQLAGVASK